MSGFKEHLKAIIPHPGLMVLSAALYIYGFVSDALGAAGSYGFLTGDMTVCFSHYPGFRAQFIDYLGGVALGIFISNIKQALLFIFTLTTAVPVLNLFVLAGGLLHALISRMGLYGILVYAGTLHIHLEVVGCLLSLEAAAVFFYSLMKSVYTGSAEPFKRAFRERLVILLPVILLVFAAAAILEVFWSTWWVYTLTQQQVSWSYFHGHVCSVRVG